MGVTEDALMLAVANDAREPGENGPHVALNGAIEVAAALGHLAEPDGGKVRAVGAGGRDRADVAPEAGLGRAASGLVGGEGGGQGLKEVVQDGAVEGGFIGEVVVEHGLVEAGPAGDAVHLGAVEPAGGELAGRGGKEAGAGGSIDGHVLTNHLVNLHMMPARRSGVKGRAISTRRTRRRPAASKVQSRRGPSVAFFSRTEPALPVELDTASGAPLIALRDLEKSYVHGPTRTWVLRRVGIDIADGEFVSIMGPSGAGKSTLLHILGMHDSAWSGEYFFGGVPVHRLSPKDRARLHKQHIGFVFQSYHLLDHLTVYENLEVPLSYRDVRKADRDSMVCDVLDRFSIVGKKDLYPNQLSGGQQQLIAVARAVIANPKVILADEPTGNLHSSQGKEIMELFKKLNDAGTTIIQVTHSETNATYGTRVIELKDGWVV
jgi:putative ABC transport system ATP-binding protein